jgi:hypothetical protein
VTPTGAARIRDACAALADALIGAAGESAARPTARATERFMSALDDALQAQAER